MIKSRREKSTYINIISNTNVLYWTCSNSKKSCFSNWLFLQVYHLFINIFRYIGRFQLCMKFYGTPTINVYCIQQVFGNLACFMGVYGKVGLNGTRFKKWDNLENVSEMLSKIQWFSLKTFLESTIFFNLIKFTYKLHKLNWLNVIERNSFSKFWAQYFQISILIASHII